jgi:hypothetical protein
MVGAGRVLTHPSGYSGCRAEEGPCAAYARGSGHSFAVHRMVLFVTRMSLIYDKNSINTIFTPIQ